MPGTYQKLLLNRFDLEVLSSAVTDGNFEQRLLQGGEFRAELDRLLLPNCRLDRGVYSLRCLGMGAVPEGWLNVGLNYCPKIPGWVNGVYIGVAHLQIFAEGSPIDYMAMPGSAWYALQVKREFLQQLALSSLGRELPLPKRGFKSYQMPHAAAMLFHKHLEFIFNLAQLLERCQQESSYGLLEERLLAALAEVAGAAMFHQPSQQWDPRFRQKQRALFIAEGYIKQQVQAGVPFREVMQAVSLSEASLCSTFQNRREVLPFAGKRWLETALNRDAAVPILLSR